jgi:peptide/nickel transport system permease protein
VANDHLSQWGLIWRQFRRHPLAVAAAVVVVLLVTISIWAPFLAHDRPLWYRGVNRFEFREAVRTLREVVSRLPVQPPGATLSPDEEAKQRDVWKSINLQVRLIRPSLEAEDQAWLAQWLAVAEQAQTAADGTAKLRELQRSLRQKLGGSDVVLASHSAWPVVASLSWADVFFLTWNLALLTAWWWQPAIARRFPPPHTRPRRAALFACWVGIPVICAAMWWWSVPQRVDRTPYKSGVMAGETDAATAPVSYESVVWPPISFGIDENVLANKALTPAIWREQSEKQPVIGRWDAPHWLGTDDLGRDVLCRMIWGGRISLAVGIVAVAIYVSIGIVVGAIAGYFRGVCDLIVSRIIEVVICFPAFFLILTIVAFVGPGLFNIMVVIGLTGWTGIARLIRGEFLRLVDQEFVLAGRALGYSPARLIFRHILPNAMAPVLVSATFGVAGAILTESSLSFLGLGITVPTPSWGGILASGRDAIFRSPWLIVFPGLAIFITITCYNLVGEALRDASDPRLRGSR